MKTLCAPKPKPAKGASGLPPADFTMQLGNLTAGELCWLGQLVELMCDPARAREWAAFRRQQRLLLYTEGALECVTLKQLVQPKAN